MRRLGGPSVGLHPDAIADPEIRTGGPRCGNCEHREPGSGRNRDYPKCVLSVFGQLVNVTGGPATDCRAWWPGCVSWKPIPEESDDAAE